MESSIVNECRAIYRIELEPGLEPTPQKHELDAARIVAEYFKSNVTFLRRRFGATPDFIINKTGQIWELKSPKGNGKHTIANNLREACRQSQNVILDLSRCKLNNTSALSKINAFLKSKDAHLKRLIVIDKRKKVLTLL